ncbi:MAG: hypothetical protein ACAI34_04060 [Verrucomicrobium sp.]
MKQQTALVTAFAFPCLLATPLFAQQVAPKTAAYQHSVSQEQLRLETRRQEMEMLEVLGQLGQYDFTKTEHGELKDVLGQLDGVAEKDMPEVVRILREASRQEQTDQTKSRLVSASSGQKNIQTQLRNMADRLLLQRDQATLQQRLRALALRQKTNERETRRLAKLDQRPENVPAEQSSALALAKAEQAALKEEIRLLRESLDRLANRAATGKEAFREALNTANGRGLENLPREAVERLNRNLNEATHAEERIHDGLVAVIENLNAKKPKEEQLRELAEEIHKISDQQERLAQSTPKAEAADQQSLKKEQEKLSDQMELAQKALEKLNGQSAQEARKIEETSEKLSEKLDTKDLLKKAENVAQVADAQTDLAKKLDALGDSLMEQAQQLAENDASQPEKQAQALAEKLQALAQQQEKLAEATAQAPSANQEDLKKQQEQLAAQVESAQKAIENLSPEAAAETKQAAEQSNKAEEMLAQQGFLDTPENKTQVGETQKNIAEDLKSASKALQEKVQALAEARQNQPTPEQMAEQSAAVAETLRDLAQQQEKLADAAAEAKGAEQQAAMQQQQAALTEQVKSAQAAAEKLNAEAGADSAKASQEAQSASEMLKQDGALEQADKKGALAQKQENAADQLNAASEKLQAQADAMAEAQMEAKEAAIAEAVNQVMNARSQVQLAQRQMEQGAEAPSVKERLGKAEEAFAEAAKMAEAIGVPVPESVGKALEAGEKNADEAQAGLNKDTQQAAPPEKVAAKTAEALQNANQALAGLQEAAAQLAAQQDAQAKAAQQMAQNAQKSGQKKGPTKPDQSKAANSRGEFMESQSEASDFSAISKLRGGQRDALDLLKQEKVSPEYEALVQQYIRNLADGQVPTP